MSGRLYVVGLGPGSPEQITPEALAAVAACSEIYGYGPYIDRLKLRPDQRRIASDNRQELTRAHAALESAAAGNAACLVSGGDPGIFAMAAAVCEAVEAGPPEWRALDIAVVPGVTAMLAVAARVGAPLGHDFCVMSLSDNLKPWPVITGRLKAAAAAGFAIALYNPVSRHRPWQLGEALEILRAILTAETPIVFGRAAGRPDESIVVTTLAEADPALADMATCIIVGSPETRRVPREGLPDLVYTPRFAKGSPA